MADGAAAELQYDVFAEMIEQLMHLAGVNAAGRYRHQPVEAGPVLVKEHAVLQPHRIVVFAANVVIAARGRWIAFELADHSAGMDVIDAREPHPFRDHPERDARIALPRQGPIPLPMHIEDDVVA